MPRFDTNADADVATDAVRASVQPERFHALDAVRGYALLLGILFHATMSFLDAPGPAWLIVDSSPSTTLTVVFYVLHLFRMATFFLIAGFFAHLLFHRRGLRGFVRDRSRRIALPLLAGWPISIAAIVGCAIWGAWVMNGGQLPAPPETASPGPLLAFPLTHLWFLYLLLWLYAATLGCRTLLSRSRGWPALRARLDRGMAALVGAPLGVLLLAVPTWLGLLAVPNWQPWLGVPTPDQSLLPNIAAVAAFGSTFAFGWLLHRQPTLLRILEQRAHGYAVVAVALTAACLAHVGLQVDTTIASIAGAAAWRAGGQPGIVTAGMDWTLVLYAAGYALALWSWSFAFIGVALRYLSSYSARRRYIADASYWMYLVHLPLVLVLQILVAPLPWHWSSKLSLILIVAIVILLASYRWWVRGTAIGAVLNGRRLPPR